MSLALRFVVIVLLGALLTAAPLVAQGPVVLMGIDPEDGGLGAHGKPEVYVEVISRMLSMSSSPGSGILVVGGGKELTDNVTVFWDYLGSNLGVRVDYVSGPARIAALTDLSTHKLVAIASSMHETFSGGLTEQENNALSRQSELIKTFVNDHGGALFSTSQARLANPYGYLGGLAVIGSNFPTQYPDINPTDAGLSLGITNALDVCCWHDEYTRFPSFLQTLATNTRTNEAAAIGGLGVRIDPPDNCSVPRFSDNPVPIWRYAPLCNCVQDDVSRSFGCRLNHPDFLLERWIPWPIFPGQEFTIRYELQAFADLDAVTWKELLPEGFALGQNHPTEFDIGPLTSGQSLERTLSFRAPKDLGELEGKGTLVMSDGREHHTLTRFRIANKSDLIEPRTDPMASTEKERFPWWWIFLTTILVVLSWLLASRRGR